MHEATIRLDVPEKLKKIVYGAISPDLRTDGRAKVALSEDLTVKIEAKDYTAMRASMNTIMRLAKAAQNAAEVK